MDTGQSSSLVAVHLACESLPARRVAQLALAGGVNLNLARREHAAAVEVRRAVTRRPVLHLRRPGQRLRARRGRRPRRAEAAVAARWPTATGSTA